MTADNAIGDARDIGGNLNKSVVVVDGKHERMTKAWELGGDHCGFGVPVSYCGWVSAVVGFSSSVRDA